MRSYQVRIACQILGCPIGKSRYHVVGMRWRNLYLSWFSQMAEFGATLSLNLLVAHTIGLASRTHLLPRYVTDLNRGSMIQMSHLL